MAKKTHTALPIVLSATALAISLGLVAGYLAGRRERQLAAAMQAPAPAPIPARAEEREAEAEEYGNDIAGLLAMPGVASLEMMFGDEETGEGALTAGEISDRVGNHASPDFFRRPDGGRVVVLPRDVAPRRYAAQIGMVGAGAAGIDDFRALLGQLFDDGAVVRELLLHVDLADEACDVVRQFARQNMLHLAGPLKVTFLGDASDELRKRSLDILEEAGLDLSTEVPDDEEEAPVFL